MATWAFTLWSMAPPGGRSRSKIRPGARFSWSGQREAWGDGALTELSFESAESPFDDLSPEEFFERFPAGDYRIFGRTIDGKTLKGSAEFTHVMPAAPAVEVKSGAGDCDAGPVPAVSEPFGSTGTRLRQPTRRRRG
jgi:hypothetical protein